MDTLGHLRAFVRSVELGSLSAAARELRVSQPTVSKAIAALERRVEARLIERTTTRLAPTGAGLRFLELARRMLEDWDEAGAALRDDADRPAGLLRLNAPLGFGELHLSGLVRRFLALHPAVRAELILDDRYVDLVEERVDVAIRIGGPLPATAVARTLGAVRRVVVAAPAYLRRHAPIREPADLAGHEFVRFAWLASGSRAVLVGPQGRSAPIDLAGRLAVNSAVAIRAAVLAGEGLGFVPGWLVQDRLDAGELLRVLPDWHDAPQPLRALVPSRRHLPARTRAFLAFFAEAVRQLPGVDAPAG